MPLLSIKKSLSLLSFTCLALASERLEATGCLHISDAESYTAKLTGGSCPVITIEENLIFTDPTTSNLFNGHIFQLASANLNTYTLIGTGGAFDLLTMTNSSGSVNLQINSTILFTDGTLTVDQSYSHPIGTVVFQTPDIFGSGSSMSSLSTNSTTSTFEFQNSGTCPANIAITNSLELIANSHDVIFGGVISGDSVIFQANAGSICLAGSNTFSGGSTFSAGTLKIGNNNSLGTGNLTVNLSSTGTLFFPSDVSIDNNIVIQSNHLEINTPSAVVGTLSGSFSTTSSAFIVTKTGIGTLVLTGNSSGFTSPLHVTQGSFLLNGSLGGDLVIASDVSMNGTGAVGGNLTLSGYLSPGNSSGITHVTGNAVLDATSTLNIDCDANGISQLIATGTVSIEPGATLTLTALPSFSVNSAVNTFIIESSGLSGTFSTVGIISPALVNTTLVYSANNLLLQFRLTEFNTIGLIGNPLAVGLAFDEILASGNTALNGVIDTLTSFTTPEISSALNQMHPALFKGLAISQENNALKVKDSLGYRMQNELDRKSCCSFVKDQKDPSKKTPCSQDENMIHIWADGFGDILHQKSITYAASYQFGYQNKTGGVVVGIDSTFADIFYAGVLGGYTGSDIHFSNNQGKADIDTGYTGIYFSTLGKMFYVNASILGGFSHFHGKRNVIYPGMNATATNSHGGAQLLSHLDTGINLGFNGFTIRPFNSFDYISQSEGSYTETGAGSLNLKISSNNSIMLRNELGLQFAECFCFASGSWTLSPKISWIREVRIKGAKYSSKFVNTDESFEITGYFPDRSLVSPGIMISGILWQDHLVLDLYYSGEFGKKYSDHNYGGQIRFGF